MDDPISSRIGLNKSVVAQIFIYIQCIHFFGIKASKEHVYDQQNVDAVFVLKTFFLSFLDALADVLIIILIGKRIMGGKIGTEHFIIVGNVFIQFFTGVGSLILSLRFSG